MPLAIIIGIQIQASPEATFLFTAIPFFSQALVKALVKAYTMHL